MRRDGTVEISRTEPGGADTLGDGGDEEPGKQTLKEHPVR